MSHFDVVSSQPLAIMSSKFEQMDQYSPHSCDREALKGQKGQSGLFPAVAASILRQYFKPLPQICVHIR